MFKVKDAFYYDVGEQRFYVHECICDNIDTTYVTTCEWNCTVGFIDGYYVDQNDNYMWVFEPDEAPYHNIRKWLDTHDIKKGMRLFG